MLSLVVKIIGGVCGGTICSYATCKIYDYIYTNPRMLTHHSASSPEHISIEDILSREVLNDDKLIKENFNKIDIIKYKNSYDYDYDNEHGNGALDCCIINDALYNKSYRDFYYYLSSFPKNN